MISVVCMSLSIANFLQSLLVKNCDSWSVFSEDVIKVQ